MSVQSLWLLLVGTAAGILSGLFGIGGGALMVPAMVMILGLSIQQASGLSLAAMVLPVGLLGVIEYLRSGRLQMSDLQLAAWLALGLFLGAWAGAKLGEQLSGLVLRRGFAVFLVVMAARMWFGQAPTR